MMREKRKKNKGFTLVELIVVLVILAVLAAVLVPVLLGYIEKARNKKDLARARQMLEAVQSELIDLYAKNGDVPTETPVIPEARRKSSDGNAAGSKNNGDQDITTSSFKKRVLSLLGMSEDEEPFLFLIGIGSNANNPGSSFNSLMQGVNMTKHDKYTVFYAIYKETKDSKMLFYFNGQWTEDSPRNYSHNGSNSINDTINAVNVFTKGELKGKRMQYYLICYNGTKYSNNTIQEGGFWNDLWSDKLK